jgi:hypothetical protein
VMLSKWLCFVGAVDMVEIALVLICTDFGADQNNILLGSDSDETQFFSTNVSTCSLSGQSYHVPDRNVFYLNRDPSTHLVSQLGHHFF